MALRTFHYVLAFKVWSDVEQWDGAEIAFLPNTPQLVDWADEHVALFRGLKAMDHGLVNLRYWDYNLYMYKEHKAIEAVYEKVCENEWDWVPHLTVDDAHIVMTEAESVSVNGGGLSWRMSDRYADVGFYTAGISPCDMRKMLTPVQVLVAAHKKGRLHDVEGYYDSVT